MQDYQIEAIKDGARVAWTVQAYTLTEAADAYYDTVTSEHDELIGIESADGKEFM